MLDKMRENAQSWGIKILFAIIILAFVISFGAPQGDSNNVIAYVNGDPIGVDEFNQMIPREAGQQPDVKRAVLFQMVNSLLMEQLAAQNGITVSDIEVQRAIQAMPEFQNNGAFSMEIYKRALGSKPERFEESQRSKLLLSKINRYTALPAQPGEAEVRALFLWQNEQAVVDYAIFDPADFFDKADVSEEAVQKYYQEQQALFREPAKVDFQYIAFTPAALALNQEVTEPEIEQYYAEAGATLVHGKRYQFRHILLPVGDSPTQESVNALQKKITALLDALQKGKSFESLAKANAPAGDTAPGEPIWMEPSEMPQEMADALHSLDKGQVSQPIITAAGLNLVQLVDVQEPQPMSLEDARPIIKERLAQEKAAKILGDKLEETIAQMNQGVELPQIAESLGLAVKDTGPMTRAQLVEQFGLTDEAAETMINLLDDTTTKTPLKIGNGGYLLARKTAELPEVVMPLESVRQQIEVDLRKLESRELAMEAAQEFLVKASKDESGTVLPALPLTESAPFVRSGDINGLRVDPQLTADAFTTQPGKWLPYPYASASGFVVARLQKTLPASEQLWEAQRQGWAQAALDIYRRELYQGLTGSLFTQADAMGGIELVRPDLLN
ncbi:MAG: SurA N-terminal domain-containing protein [Desulfovibrionaceae bacterium]